MKFFYRVEVADRTDGVRGRPPARPAPSPRSRGRRRTRDRARPRPLPAARRPGVVRRAAPARPRGSSRYEALRVEAAPAAPRLRDRPPHHPARAGLDRHRRAPAEGLLPGPGDGRPGPEPGQAAAPAGLPAPRRQRGAPARRTARRSGSPTTGADGRKLGFVTTSVRHHELGPVALALVKRNVPVDARCWPARRRPRRRSSSSRSARSGPRASDARSSTVNGPSFVSETRMSAPNRPVSTVAPSARSCATTSSTSGSATSPGAAAFQVGRRPLRASPYSVNWLITSSGASRSRAGLLAVQDAHRPQLAGQLGRLLRGVVVGDPDQDAQPLARRSRRPSRRPRRRSRRPPSAPQHACDHHAVPRACTHAGAHFLILKPLSGAVRGGTRSHRRLWGGTMLHAPVEGTVEAHEHI